MMEEVGVSLYEIYKAYFIHELSHKTHQRHLITQMKAVSIEKKWRDSEKKLFDFLRDF
jgi:hypothetical protein